MTVFVSRRLLPRIGDRLLDPDYDRRHGERQGRSASSSSSRSTKDGKPFDAVDFNFWGITFDPTDSEPLLRDPGHRRRTTTWSKAASAAKSMRVLRDGVECPSLSPDGKQIAYKSRIGDENRWRLRVLDVATLEDHAGRREALDRRPGRVARRRHPRLLRRHATSTRCPPTAAAKRSCWSATRPRRCGLTNPGKNWPIRHR